jgi:Tripartite tricarboxylate transporter TctB family
LSRFLSKDFLSGVMFIAFGLTALWFGRHLALGTSVRMGPGYVPHMLADIMMVLGTIISLVPLYANASTREKETIWAPVGGAAVVLILAIRYVLPLPASLAQLGSDWLLLVAVVGVFTLLLICILINISRGSHAASGEKIDLVEAPKWRPITMVTIGIVVFALMFETTGMFPSLVALVLIASWGGDEFKLWEVVGNIVVLTILCVVVFKIGLSMNIAVINGVW